MSGELSLRDFKAALFDVDGTLVDSTDRIARGLGDAIEWVCGARPSEEEIRGLIGRPLGTQLALYFPVTPTAAELERAIDYAISRYEHHKGLERPFPAAIEAMRACHRAGMKTALVTSKNAREMELFFDRFAGRECVDATVCASDVERPKPDPECALRACQLLGVRPNEALMVGDSTFDIQCARDAGVVPVAVAYGSAPREALLRECPALLVQSPEELLEWAETSLSERLCAARRI